MFKTAIILLVFAFIAGCNDGGVDPVIATDDGFYDDDPYDELEAFDGMWYAAQQYASPYVDGISLVNDFANEENLAHDLKIIIINAEERRMSYYSNPEQSSGTGCYAPEGAYDILIIGENANGRIIYDIGGVAQAFKWTPEQAMLIDESDTFFGGESMGMMYFYYPIPPASFDHYPLC